MKKSLGKKDINKNILKNAKRSLPVWAYQLTLFIFAFILYGNTIKNGYSIDDDLVVYNNEQVQKGFQSIPEIFSSHYSEGERNNYGYRPIAKVTFAIESQFLNQNPHISHLINVILYAFLLMILMKIIFRLFCYLPRSISFLIILLFASHPVHTEVVASLKNREELLCFLFASLSMLSFIRACNRGKRSLLNPFLGILYLALSIFSKQTGVVFCLIIPLTLFFYFYDNENNAINKSATIITNHRRIYFILFTATIIVLGCLVFLLPRFTLPAGDKVLYGFENQLYLHDSILHRICIGSMGLLYYLKFVFFPFSFGFYYGFDMVPLKSISDYRVIISLLVHLSLILSALILYKKNNVISYGIFFYLAGLSIFTNLISPVPGIIGERLIFVSSFGYCIAFVGTVHVIARRIVEKGFVKIKNTSGFLNGIIAVIIVIFSFQTIIRNKDWRDSMTLYKSDIQNLSRSAKANAVYADELSRSVYDDIKKKINSNKTIRNTELAIAHYKIALEIYPEYPSVNNNIGSLYFNVLNNYDSAIYFFKQAILSDSIAKEPYFNLATSYDKNGDSILALSEYRRAYTKDTCNILLLSQWANLHYALTKDMDSALLLNNKIKKINPSVDIPYINIGNYFLAKNDTLNAISQWEKAIKISPENESLKRVLNSYYQSKNKPE